MDFRPLRGEVLAKADVKGKAEVAGPEVDTIVAAHGQLVHIFVENLDKENYCSFNYRANTVSVL